MAPLAFALAGLTGLGLPLHSYICHSRIQVEGLATFWDYSTIISWLREGAKAESNLTGAFKAAWILPLSRLFPFSWSKQVTWSILTMEQEKYTPSTLRLGRGCGHRGIITQCTTAAFFLFSWYVKQWCVSQ